MLFIWRLLVKHHLLANIQRFVNFTTIPTSTDRIQPRMQSSNTYRQPGSQHLLSFRFRISTTHSHFQLFLHLRGVYHLLLLIKPNEVTKLYQHPPTSTPKSTFPMTTTTAAVGAEKFYLLSPRTVRTTWSILDEF